MSGTGGSSALGLAGVIGMTNKVESGSADYNNLVNVGKLVFTATGSNPAIGGIFGHDRTSATAAGNDIIKDSQSYCDIVAVGKEGNVGMIMGLKNTATRYVQNCGVAGNLIFAQDKQEETDDDGNTTETVVDIPTPITESNLLSYIYPAAVTEANGCYVLETKPVRPVFTYTPAE